MSKVAINEKTLCPIHKERDVEVIVHTGVSGSGKTYFLAELDRDKTYVGTDYSNLMAMMHKRFCSWMNFEDKCLSTCL